jgi:hypothetical protein
MATKKTTPPSFATETREAEWWAKNQARVADHFEQARARGKLERGTVARVAQERAAAAVSARAQGAAS